MLRIPSTSSSTVMYPASPAAQSVRPDGALGLEQRLEREQDADVLGSSPSSLSWAWAFRPSINAMNSACSVALKEWKSISNSRSVSLAPELLRPHPVGQLNHRVGIVQVTHCTLLAGRSDKRDT